MAAARRKVFEVRGIAGSGGRFRVGTIVENQYGAPGIILRIIPVDRHDALGPRAWVAYDRSARVRTWQRTPEGMARELAEARGVCEVHRERLYMLKPIGQAKRIPRCVLTTRPGYERPARGHWVKASRPPRRKTPRERRAEIEASLREHERKSRQSRGRFPIYKASPFEGAAGIAKVIESYERFAHWHRQYAQGHRNAIVKHNAKGALRRQWLAEAMAEERLAARAERVIARLRGHHLILEAHKAVR